MEDKNVEFICQGIVCDNPECDYVDMSVNLEDYQDWLNKPCPKCGENLLTEEDHSQSMALEQLAAYVNTLSPEAMSALGELGKKLNIAEQFGLSDIEEDDVLTVSFNTHGPLSIKEIKVDKCETDGDQKAKDPE